jgi:hypothetical protein
VKNRRRPRHGVLFTELGKTEILPGSVGSCGGGAAGEEGEWWCTPVCGLSLGGGVAERAASYELFGR